MWSTHVWNMFDFAADARDQGGEPGMNHKGLMTFDRKVKKDSFYIYKAYWSKEPFVHLCGSRYVDRTEAVTTVKVYSNQTKVALYANGKLLEEKTGNKVFEFRVPLKRRSSSGSCVRSGKGCEHNSPCQPAKSGLQAQKEQRKEPELGIRKKQLQILQKKLK